MFVILSLILFLSIVSISAESTNDTGSVLSDNSTFIEDNDTSNSTVNILDKTNVILQNKSVISSNDSNYTVRLVDSNSKPIANQTVRVNVNSSIFSGVTNNEGFITFDFSDMGDGRYTLTALYKGNEFYDSSSNSTTLYKYDGVLISSNLNSYQIQNIIDKASPGTRLYFTDEYYSNLYLVINKPLSLISYVGSTLNSRKDKPIITIDSTAGPVVVSGFNINSTRTDGIVIENASNITISQNTITSKSNGIKAIKVENLNIINNNIIGNSKSGASISEGNNIDISNNLIRNNDYGVGLAQSSNIKIWNNSILNNTKGVYSSVELNNYIYSEGASNLSMMYNTVKNNHNGIELEDAGSGIQILNNTISNNINKGISLNKVGSNTITQNVIERNSNGIYFGTYYIKPKGQDISYNVIQSNTFRDVNAKDSSYGFGNDRLEIGNNWYGGNPAICNKIKTGLITFGVKQTGTNTATVTFYNPDGSVVVSLPSRTISYKNNNGRVTSISTTGSSTKISIEGSNGDKITVTIDKANQQITYQASSDDFTDPSLGKIDSGNVKTQDDVDRNWQKIHGNGGNSGTDTGGNSGGNSGGNGTSNNQGNGGSNSGSNSNSGISGSSTGANTAIGFSTAATAVASSASGSSSSSDSSSNDGSDSASSSSDGASESSSAGSDSGPKFIDLDENQVTRIAGEFLVFLIILLSCYIYYRDDIKNLR